MVCSLESVEKYFRVRCHCEEAPSPDVVNSGEPSILLLKQGEADSCLRFGGHELDVWAEMLVVSASIDILDELTYPAMGSWSRKMIISPVARA